MKHLDKPFTHFKPISQTKFQPGYKSKHFKKELLPILILISVGIIGTLYSFNMDFGKRVRHTPSKITSNQIMHDGEHLQSKPDQKEKPLLGNTALTLSPKDQLLIEGEKEAKQLLSFSIENFDKKARYDLHLGDGSVLHPINSSAKYAYQREGHYKVQLFVNYEGKSAQLYSQTIEIVKAIEIDFGAHREN